jgi:hypothetical protein
MINESYVWKQELKKELSQFTRQILKNDSLVREDNNERVHFRIEKFFFMSSFIIRKLNEAHKLSDELNETKVPIKKSARINKDIVLSRWNNHHIDRFYKLDEFQSSFINVSTLCNSIIHSFIFNTVFNVDEEDGDYKMSDFSGIIFNSDFSKESYLYYLEVDNFIPLLKDAIKDVIVYSRTLKKGGKIIKEVRSRVMPPDDREPTFPKSPQLEK